MNLLLTKVNSSTETKDWQVSVFVCMSVFVSKAWPSCVYSVSLVMRGSLLHLYPIILYFLLTLRLEHSQYNRCLAGYQTERVLSLVGFFFSFSLVNLLPSLALRHLDLAAAVSDSNTVYVVWFAWPAPPACIAPMLTYKNISFRGNLASFSCRRVSSPPEFLCMWHMYFLCHPVFFILNSLMSPYLHDASPLF